MFFAFINEAGAGTTNLPFRFCLLLFSSTTHKHISHSKINFSEQYQTVLSG